MGVKSTDRSQSNGFRSLAGYIFGGNKKRGSTSAEKIAMTGPVLIDPQASSIKEPTSATPETQQTTDESPMTMTFIMPSKYQCLDDLPIPNDSKIKLTQVSERTFAAITFSGTASEAKCQEQEDKLKQELKMDRDVKVIDPSAKGIAAFYNPPWTIPWYRTNEILVPVEYVKQ
ncbi:hypothetical protein BZG36_02936 [Bifiguratus adelaidae]|uniref:SOUL heme-binding protein n=1 Tax=Bifiguratus adelaidae TaxID=1938954 RepID=A0A261XZZ6_9FUNG|nr:hypothetical protein BZG36_02936 [Bifiguratus adelaidae]